MEASSVTGVVVPKFSLSKPDSVRTGAVGVLVLRGRFEFVLPPGSG